MRKRPSDSSPKVKREEAPIKETTEMQMGGRSVAVEERGDSRDAHKKKLM